MTYTGNPYKSGDHVVFIGDRGGRRPNPIWYPEIGTVGVVIKPSGKDEVYVQWPDGSTSDEGRWYCGNDFIELCCSYDDLKTADYNELDAFLNEMGGD